MGDVALVDRLRPGDHLCWTFAEDAERAEVIRRYVHAGLHSGHKVVYFAATPGAETALDQVGGGPRITRAVESGQLLVAGSETGYLDGGHFCREATSARLRRMVQQARWDGYPALRALGDMAWAVGAVHGELHRYEAEMNPLYAEAYAMAVCLYDRRLFPHRELCALIAAHPGSTGPLSRPGEEPLLRFRRGPEGLSLCGEADLSNRDAVAAVLVQEQGQELTLDLSELRFADAAVCQMIVDGCREGRLRTVGALPAIRRLLELAESR